MTVLVRALHGRSVRITNRYPGERRAAKWKIQLDSEALRKRVLALLGRDNVGSEDTRKRSNCGAHKQTWSSWMAGSTVLPGKYHLAISNWLMECGA